MKVTPDFAQINAQLPRTSADDWDLAAQGGKQACVHDTLLDAVQRRTEATTR